MPLERNVKISSLRPPKHQDSISKLILGKEAQLLTNSRELSIIGLRQCLDVTRSCWNRSMWIFLVAFGFLLSAYQINDRIICYFSYTTSSEVDVVSVESLDFPQVTICNENYIKRHEALQEGLIDYFKAFMPPYTLFVNNTEHVEPLNYSQEKLLSLRKLLSPGKEQLFKCWWQNQDCPEAMAELIFTNHGQCLTFNPRKLGLVATNVGSTSGLTLVLFANHSDYFVQFGSSVGYMLLLHEPNEPPRIRELGGKVGVGQAVNVAVSTSNIFRLKYPHGSCRDEASYHPVKCRMECEKKFIYKECGCRAIYMPGEEDICDYFVENDCVYRILQELYSRSDANDLCLCSPLCHEVSYSATVSQSGFSKNFVNEMTANPSINMSFEMIRDNFVHLQIFMSEMQVAKISTVASYSFMALLSDIGGALGLFLGSTLLTYFEIIDLICQLIWCKIATRKNKRHKSSVVHIY